MKNYTFKLNNEEIEFTPIEVSKEMRWFLEDYEERTLSAETEEYKIQYVDAILEALQESADFERSVSDGAMGEYGSLYPLFEEYERVIKSTGGEFVGIKK